MNKKTRLYYRLIISTLMLSACNLPANNNQGASSTAAAQTITALLSSTPAIASPVSAPTFTPLPAVASATPAPAATNTPIPSATSNCNAMEFVTDVTYPDGSIVTPGQSFTKTWRVKNIGTCAWTPSYAVVFSDGTSMNGPSTQALAGNVNPGQTLDISVNLTAPGGTGDYTGNWKLRDASGVLFGRFYVQVKVQNPVTATYTLPPAIVFSVTSVTYNVSGTCGNFHVSANITTNGAGTVKYFWQANGSDDFEGTYNSTLNFASAGTQTTSTIDWAISAPGSHYLRVFINTPNNQFISQSSNMVCP